MQPARLLETSPFQDILFLEVERTNQWKVLRLPLSVIMLFCHTLSAKEYEKQFELV